MQKLIKKTGIAGVLCLCGFVAAGTGNSNASIQNGNINIAGAETRQAKKVYKYKQDKKQVKEFSSIKADVSTLDIVIKQSGSKDFYISYNLNCNNSSNPLSYKVENGILSIKESKLKWPVGNIHINNNNKKDIEYIYANDNGKKGTEYIYGKKNKKIIKGYTNKIYVYIPSETDLKDYNFDIGLGDLFMENISLRNGKIIANSGDIDINVPAISGSMDIKTESGDIDINTNRNTKITTNIDGQLNINTDSGDVDIHKSVINKIFKIKTESGDAGINADINGQLNINTDSGDIDIYKSAINKTFNIKTESGDIEIFNSVIKGRFGVKTKDGDTDIENLDISGSTDIQTKNGDVDIKFNNKYIDKIGINLVTKNGDMYIKKLYKGTKIKNGSGYKYTKNKNKTPSLNVLVTGWGDIELK